MAWHGRERDLFSPFLQPVFPLRLIWLYPLPQVIPGGSSLLTCPLKKPHKTPQPSDHRLIVLPASEAILVYQRALWIDRDLRPGFVLKKIMYQRTNPKSLWENAQFSSDSLCKGGQRMEKITHHISNWISGSHWYTVIMVGKHLCSNAYRPQAAHIYKNPSVGNQAAIVLGVAQSIHQEGLGVGKVLGMEKSRLKGDPVSPDHGSEAGWRDHLEF